MNTEKPLVKNRLTVSLRRTGLAPAFFSLCASGASSADVLAWIAGQPELASCGITRDSLQDMRLRAGVPAPRGGKREGRGQTIYSVAGLRS